MHVRWVVGGAVCLVGALWIGQGIGWIGSSFMTGEAIWSVIGTVVVVFGIIAPRWAAPSYREEVEPSVRVGRDAPSACSAGSWVSDLGTSLPQRFSTFHGLGTDLSGPHQEDAATSDAGPLAARA